MGTLVRFCPSAAHHFPPTWPECPRGSTDTTCWCLASLGQIRAWSGRPGHLGHGRWPPGQRRPERQALEEAAEGARDGSWERSLLPTSITQDQALPDSGKETCEMLPVPSTGTPESNRAWALVRAISVSDKKNESPGELEVAPGRERTQEGNMQAGF